MKAAGWSLDDKRQPLLLEDKIGLQPLRDGHSLLSEAEHTKNNLPDVLARWSQRHGSELQRSRTDQSFCVPKADIAGNDYDLSINRYKEVVHAASEHLPPQEILAKLAVLEAEIASGRKKISPKDLLAKRAKDNQTTQVVDRTKVRFQRVLEGLRGLLHLEKASDEMD
jgi:type I restriction enzyme M protein